MADNIAITPGAGASVATDDVGGVHYQITKLAYGALDSVTLVSGSNPLPISGTVTANVGTVPVTGTFWQATQPVSIAATVAVSGPLTDAQLRATAVPVSGTFYQATQPVSAASLPLPSGAATSAKQPALGTAGVASTDVITVQGIASGVAQPVSGTFWQATQPISGTVTANIGTSGSLALDATLTGGTQQSKITDGTNVATVKAASTAAGAADKAVVVAISPNNTVGVTGTFWQATQPVSLATNTPTIAAGSAIIGKVGIDQTTVGTTNAISLAQIGANTVLTGNGVAGTGAQRVTIASDNTAFAVNATLQTGANVIGALTANQSVNVAQMNGVAVTMGSGVTGTGVQRVVLATDVALPTGSNVIGALTANQSVNNAQIAGVATSTGNGVVGTGVQRVAIASDNTAFTVNAAQATASSLNAQVQGNIASGAADSGNPVKSGGRYNATQPTLTDGQRGDVQLSSRGRILSGTGGTYSAQDALPNSGLFGWASDDDAATAARVGVVAAMSYNGTTWDRVRGMGGNATTGDTGAKTATGNGATQTNVGNTGVQILVVLGTVTGTSPTAVFKVQGSVDGGTTWYDIPAATTASLTATGNFGITVYPGIVATVGTTTTGTTAAASQVLPRTWRVVWTIGGTTPSFTITNIQYNYLVN